MDWKLSLLIGVALICYTIYKVKKQKAIQEAEKLQDANKGHY